MFDQLSQRLQQTFRNIQGKGTLSDDNMADAIREIRRALLEADVNLQVIKRFIDRIKDRADGANVTKGVDPGQEFTKIIHDELVTLLGENHQPINLTQAPSLIMLFGLQGSGKTTTASKLALKLKNEGKVPFLIAADVYRPAAITQLQQLGKRIEVPVHTVEGSTDVQQIVATGLAAAKENNHDVVIIDTAGRLQVDNDMMAELLLLERQFKPHNKLLVVDAMTGQEALNVAEAFDSQLSMTGMVLTKTDGDARGGAALSIAEMTGKPILYVGVSETPEGLEVFHPDRMASRILGMGDVVSLVEKAQQAVDIEEAQKLETKIRKQTFSFDDFMTIQKQLKMLGSLGGILDMLPIPGLDKQTKSQISNMGEEHLQRSQVMIQSMSKAERANPDLLQDKKRVARIAKGCGATEKDVKAFITQFGQMKAMMGQLTGMQDKEIKTAAKEADQGAFSGFGMPRRNKKKKKAAEPTMPGGLPPGFPSNMPFGGMFGGGKPTRGKASGGRAAGKPGKKSR